LADLCTSTTRTPRYERGFRAVGPAEVVIVDEPAMSEADEAEQRPVPGTSGC
jgi:hypothetical protein